jgi:hypothetical protein
MVATRQREQRKEQYPPVHGRLLRAAGKNSKTPLFEKSGTKNFCALVPLASSRQAGIHVFSATNVSPLPKSQ